MTRRLVSLLCLSLWLLPSSAWAFGAGNVTKQDNSSSAQTGKALWTPGTGLQIVVLECDISSLTAQTTTLLFGTTTFIPIQYTGANGNVHLGGGGYPIGVGAINQALNYTTTASVATSVMCSGYEQAP